MTINGRKPPTAADWEVFVLEYARSRNQPLASLVYGTFAEPALDVPFSFVLARRPGSVLLVDTGFMMEGGGAAMAAKFDVPYWVSPLRQLAELGVAPEAVTDIIVSHAHFDHMGSIDQFPNARIFLQKREMLSWIEAMALPPRYGFLTAVLDTDDIVSAIDATRTHRLTLVDGDRDDLLPGVHVRLAAGHTLGQQFALIDTARGRYAISGDCVYNRRNLTGNGDGAYLPLGTGIGSVWDQLRSFERIEDAIDGDHARLVILHDAERWPQFEVVGGLEGFTIRKVA